MAEYISKSKDKQYTRRKYFIIYVTDKGLISLIYKELPKTKGK